MRHLFLVIISVSALTSCADAPVGWGGAYKAMILNEVSATYVYDPLVGGYGKVMEEAAKHCASVGKNAVPTTSSQQGVLKSQTFECK